MKPADYETLGAPTIAWIRCPFANTGKASYIMTANGKRTGWIVQWCGHPTALRPYYIAGLRRGQDAPQHAYSSSKLARAIAEDIYREQLAAEALEAKRA